MTQRLECQDRGQEGKRTGRYFTRILMLMMTRKESRIREKNERWVRIWQDDNTFLSKSYFYVSLPISSVIEWLYQTQMYQKEMHLQQEQYILQNLWISWPNGLNLLTKYLNLLTKWHDSWNILASSWALILADFLQLFSDSRDLKDEEQNETSLIQTPFSCCYLKRK